MLALLIAPGPNLRVMNHRGSSSTPASTVSADDDRPAVRCLGVGKRRAGRSVLDDISFSMPQGASVAIVGLNGAGKTTLLRLMLDFLRPDAGRIELFGIASTQPIARRHLTFLPERYAPSPDLTGWQSLRLTLGLQSIKADRSACESDLDRLGFDLAALDAPAREYSKGMVQKLGLAGALQSAAPLTVLDEPMSGLDPLARRNLVAVLAGLRASGRGLLFTAHGLHELDALCDRIAVIHDARLAFFGSPAELCRRADSTDLEQAFLALIGALPERAPQAQSNCLQPA